MISRFKHRNFIWVDIESPTQDEVLEIMGEFGIHPLIANELLSPSARAKVDIYDNLLYLILHFPKYRHSGSQIPIQEVDFILGKDFLITTHYETIDPLHEFSKIFETDSVLNKGNISDHSGFVFYYIMKKMYQFMEFELNHIDNRMAEIEKSIFEGGKEGALVMEISHTNREIIDFKKAIKDHSEILNSFETASEKFFGDRYSYYASSIRGDFNRLWNILEGLKDVLGDLRDTNDSIFSAKANDIMQTLTIMAFVTFPLSLLAAIFGMNTSFIPIVGMPNDFWIVILIMGIGVAFMFTFFKHKKWL